MNGFAAMWRMRPASLSPPRLRFIHPRLQQAPRRCGLRGREKPHRMYILGINAYHGNASAAIIADGRLVAAVEEERFNRVKYAAGFPAAAIRYCLDAAGIALSEVDHIAIPRNPWARLGTKLLYALRMPSFAMERLKVMGQFAGISETLAKAFDVSPDAIRAAYHRIEHHQAHLASAFFVSPFDQAALLSADGVR